MARIDLDAYFGRIGHTGPSGPDLATLTRLHTLHAQHIAFENLSPLGGEPVGLDAGSLEHKLVRQRRGGYCFEQNALFQQVLGQLGFEVQALAARVRWNRPAGVPAARTHLLLLVEADGRRHIADVGFGGLGLSAPLRLEPDTLQTTPHEPYRLTLVGDLYTLEARLGRHWTALYSFDLQPQQPADLALTSWYLTHHPQSIFLNGLMCARPVPGGRHALANNRYAFRRLDGSHDKRLLTSVDALAEVLDEAFGLALPALPALREKLQALVAA